MGQISSNSALGTYAADYAYRTEQNKKSESADKTEKKQKVSGRTIGEPKLSEKAAKYYEKLKEKYSNMDFILVSADKKEEAERNKGMYQSSKELIVLIDEEKIEKMAEDENYRAKYEAILSGATSQVNQMMQSLGSNADSVTSVGITFDDNGNASFFAVVDKSLARQKERIEEKKAEKAEEKKEAAKEAAEKRLEKKKESGEKSELVTVTASSAEELIKKISNTIFSAYADTLRTDAERAVGGNIDYSL